MSLLVYFDDMRARGNNIIFDYLSSQFPTILLQTDNLSDQVKSYKESKCFFTTSISAAQEVGGSMPTVLYINDPYEGRSSRGDNISAWRQSLIAFKNIDSVFVVSSALATTFLNTYRIPCKIQYPYVPKKDKGVPQVILYNKMPPYFDKMLDFAPNESYMEYSGEEDFKFGKLYIHTPEPGEQWNINLILAHSYGVPCITYQQGCFSEFCTNGDKLLPPGADVKTWINNFKLSLRDHAINSKTVYDMSKRFNAMNEVQQRIKKALVNNNFVKTPPTFAEVQNRAPTGIVKLQGRTPQVQPEPTFKQKIVRPTVKNDDYAAVTSYLNGNASVYAGVGGLGDALLTLAAAHADPGSKVIFGASSGVQQPVSQLFDVFGIESLIVRNFNGSTEGMIAWNSILDHPHCKSSVHIPKDLNYGEWRNNSKDYLKNTITKMPLVKLLGKLVNPRATKKVIGLCPRGSDHISTWKQRFLSKDEYNNLIKKFLTENATVLVFGSESDLNYYGVYQNNNVIFMNSNFAVSYPAPRYSITMRHMLTAINSCDLIVSVDTWLKTYAALAGIPCKVIMNRYFGKSTLEYADPSDNIFLDQPTWGFEVVPLNSLL